MSSGGIDLNFGRSDGGGYDFMDRDADDDNAMVMFDTIHNTIKWNGTPDIAMPNAYERSSYRVSRYQFPTRPHTPEPVNLNYDAHPYSEPYLEQRQSRWKYAALVAGATATATGAYLWQRRPTEKQSKSATLAEPDSKKAQSIKSEL